MGERRRGDKRNGLVKLVYMLLFKKKWGVRNLQNLALLIRWWWRLYTANEDLWPHIMHNLCANSTGTNTPKTCRSAGSFFWKILIRLKPLFHWSTTWQIGNGRGIAIWYDSWDGLLVVGYHDNCKPPFP